MADSQSEAIAFLRALTGTEPVQTHISFIFIGVNTVFKLKRSVRLPYLDFTNPDTRRRMAMRELELNAPAASGLYLDVQPIVRRDDGGLALGGEGSPIDWVIRMARVPEADLFDQLAAEARLTPGLLDQLADAVAAYHTQRTPAHLDHPVGAMRRAILGNARSAEETEIPRDLIREWQDSALHHLERLSAWIERRASLGFIRRAHGDLHLGNICLWRGKPTLFDALEFDEELATIDLGYDLAFLLMDLEQQVSRPAANRVMNRYIAVTGDVGLTRGLPLFLSVRSFVRGHIAATRKNPEWHGYAQAARAYLRPAPPVLVAVGGLPGTGKSTLARALAPELGAAPGAVVLRSDEVRKRLSGTQPECKLPQEAYSESVSRAVVAELIRQAAEAATGAHAVIADATFLDPADRKAIASSANGAPFIGLWLDAPLRVLEQRVAARQGDASDATIAVLQAMAARAARQPDWTVVDSTDGGRALAAARQALHGSH
ncbi:MAG: AAA family ATPase [Acetobacteraceae bacterium]|nr:AAA family ATPase [Acetobacteraceae bacterium]MBV8525279.1 AAA family ATPase [Acetobacteraceae bacterium]MBV8591556.1 AAA family ATPase [Acetobacteraceae bacterium]